METIVNGKKIEFSGKSISTMDWRCGDREETQTVNIFSVDGKKYLVIDSSYCYDGGVWSNAGTVIKDFDGNNVYSGVYLPMDSLLDELGYWDY